jgi:Spy/CpxP family protein refolding chaperone
MKSLIIFALAVCVTLGMAQNVPDQGTPPSGRQRLREQLNLSDAQKDQIARLRDENQKNRIALRAKLDAARVEFRSLMRGPDPDEKLVMAKQKEMSAIRDELQASALANRFAMQKVFTPEQRKMMRDGMADRFGMMDGRQGWSGMRQGMRGAHRMMDRMGKSFGMRGRMGGRSGMWGKGGCPCDDNRPMNRGRGYRPDEGNDTDNR